MLCGRLLDTAGRPHSGLRLQVWQANSTGRYDYHPAETPGHGRPDPAFRGHGESDTDADGWYAYRTIRPGGYRRTLFGFLPRTFVPHIHVAVRALERDLLVTQCDLDKVVAQRPATAPADRDELMRSDAIRRLADAVGGAAVAQAELIRFDTSGERACDATRSSAPSRSVMLSAPAICAAASASVPSSPASTLSDSAALRSARRPADAASGG